MIGNVTCGCSRKGGNKDEGVYFSLTKDYSNCIYNKFLYMYLCTYRLQIQNCSTAGQWSNSRTKTLHMGMIYEEDISAEQGEEKQKVRIQKKDEHQER